MNANGGWFTLLYDDDHSNHKVKKICIYPERTKVYKELLQYWEDNKENINSVIYTNNLKNIN